MHLHAFGDQAVSHTLTAPQQVHAFGDQSVSHTLTAPQQVHAVGDQAASHTLTAPQQVHAFGDQSRGQHASVGLTTGHAFCGVVGSQGNRREYTVLGDVVNLSARLMQVLC